MSRSQPALTTSVFSPSASPTLQKGVQPTSTPLAPSQTTLTVTPVASSAPIIRTACMNYSSFMGAQNVGQSLAISRFASAVANQKVKVEQKKRANDGAVARLADAVNRGSASLVLSMLRKQRSAAYHAYAEEKARLNLYEGTLSSCIATGYSDPAKVPSASSTPPFSPVFTSVKSTPRGATDEEIFAAQEDVYTEPDFSNVELETEKKWYSNPLYLGLSAVALGVCLCFRSPTERTVGPLDSTTEHCSLSSLNSENFLKRGSITTFN